MILSIINNKGGVGKSTLCVNLAVSYANQNHKVILLDCDKQKTSTNWCIKRKQNNLIPPIPYSTITSDIRETVKPLSKEYQTILIDTMGHDDTGMRAAMIVSDIVLIPVKCNQVDLEQLPSLQKLIDKAKELNKKLQAKVVINAAPTFKGEDVISAQSFIKSYTNFTMLETIIFNRRIWADCMILGQGIEETKPNNIKANLELNQLIGELK
jgi:chromosome partitioning protein